uniref:Uncharacterized protein n=1 Tax=Arundo donax TaxID=35708 RepID=A0A0A9E1B4_ARUDO
MCCSFDPLIDLDNLQFTK